MAALIKFHTLLQTSSQFTAPGDRRRTDLPCSAQQNSYSDWWWGRITSWSWGHRGIRFEGGSWDATCVVLWPHFGRSFHVATRCKWGCGCWLSPSAGFALASHCPGSEHTDNCRIQNQQCSDWVASDVVLAWHVQVLNAMKNMDSSMFKKHLSEFYPYFTKLICSDQVQSRYLYGDSTPFHFLFRNLRWLHLCSIRDAHQKLIYWVAFAQMDVRKALGELFRVQLVALLPWILSIGMEVFWRSGLLSLERWDLSRPCRRYAYWVRFILWSYRPNSLPSKPALWHRSLVCDGARIVCSAPGCMRRLHDVLVG